MYMDNGLISAGTRKELKEYFTLLPKIFEGYKFSLQQFATNDEQLQLQIDELDKEDSNNDKRFFEIYWNLEKDTLGPYSINLDTNANTKIKILSSLNSVYDLINVYGPMLNRAKLFFHKLQCNKDLHWDAEIGMNFQEEWVRICKQANSIPTLSLDRFVGSRESEYDLVAFCDASTVCYGTVIYICLLYTSPSPRDKRQSRMPSSA